MEGRAMQCLGTNYNHNHAFSTMELTSSMRLGVAPLQSFSKVSHFFDNGRFITHQAIIPSLCITKMHTTSSNFRVSKEKKAEYISIMKI
jgi:hypothetical protein